MSKKGSLGGGGTILPNIEALTGDAGGAVGPDGAFNVNLIGGLGCVTTGTPGTNQIVFDVIGGGVTWSREAGAAIAAVQGHGYVNTNVALTTITLPLTAALGTVIEVMGESAGLYTIAQNAGQNIQFGNLSTTVGVGGSLEATGRYAAIKLICRIPNLTWSVIANVGVFDVN